MNFTVYADNDLLHNRHIVDEHGKPQFLILDPVLDETTDGFCSLTYRCKVGSPAYDRSVEMIPRIKVYEDGHLYWTGRILKSTPKVTEAEKEIYVEDFLGVLCDGIYRPFDFYGTVPDLLQMVVNENNSQVGENQQIYQVVCDVDEGNIVRSSEGYSTCWQIIKEKLLDMIGGYIWLTYDAQERAILHYSKNAKNVSTQRISFGKNLKTYKVTYDFDGFYTACVPLGAKDQQTKQYVTIASVNDDLDYLIDTANAARYGIIYAPTSETTWEDVHEPSILLSRAQEWLQNRASRLIQQIELTAHDLSGLNADLRAFHWLDSVPVDAEEISDSFVIKHISRPLDKPLQIEISMGDSRSSVTGSAVSNQNSNVERIENIESNYATNETLENNTQTIYQEIQNLASSIQQTAESIIASVLSEYVKTGDLEQMAESLRSEFQLLADSITLSVTQEISTSITNYDGTVQNQFESIYAFIRLIASGVVIGTSDSAVKMKLSGDTLYFFTGDEESVTVDNAIAYFSSEQLVVNNSRIKVLSVGYGNAYMHFSVVGEGSLQCLFLSPRRIDS
jgi:hypothetical protein